MAETWLTIGKVCALMGWTERHVRRVSPTWQTREAKPRGGKGHRLFGVHEGMWLWAMKAVGAEAPAKKDYRVWGPNPEHEPHCIVSPR